jgi:hypothetical protein
MKDVTRLRLIKGYLILARGIDSRLQYDANAISCHLTKEIERMLVAKGIAISNVFEEQNDMTYTQKKETTALLYPVITIELLQASTSEIVGRQVVNTEGTIQGRANAELVMLEPLSSEKIWIKHVYSGKKAITLNYKGGVLPNTNPSQVQENMYNTVNNIDSLLVEIDKQILKTVDKYVTKEEFIDLNDDIKKLKGIKRY